MSKEHPGLELYSTVPPKVDKYLQEFLGKCMPKEHDTELSKIQSAILTSIRLLTSAWQHLTEEGLEEDPDMLVPGAEVLSLIQRTICLIGNASEFTSQMRRVKILEAVDQSWGKFSSDKFPSAHDTLFGEEFQSSLTKRVEQDTALSKAISLTKRHRRGKDAPTSSSRQDRQKVDRFFEGALLPSTGADRAEASSRTNAQTAGTCHPAPCSTPTGTSQSRNPGPYSTNPNCPRGKHRKPHKGSNRPSRILARKRPLTTRYTHGHVISKVVSLGASGLSLISFHCKLDSNYI